ncbi:30S ribosomal protein S12 methylthiotransferase RimO [Vulgatibacter sp.]|uniref:30S ribosomal protein S12 methylthiotransferase RimO n=1 Tax=Vulgatibacter sp. TaxID=1971226 RepID=UPI0035691CC4
MTQKNVHIVTLGCPKNRVDSEIMLGGLVEGGWQLTEQAEDADVLVVNTCAFIEASKQESVEAILEAARFKTEGKAQKLVVTGCLSQRYADELSQEMPEVDHFLGTSAYAQLPKLLADVDGAPRQVIPDPDYIHSSATPRINSLPSYTAYLKISEGCDNDCAFCIIPTLRGGQRSRPIDDIVREAEVLAGQGVREINLVAQDLTAYGHDLPGRPKLHELIRALGEVKGVRWVRLHYAYPRNFPEALVAAIRDTPNVVKYLDMPVQHASDRLLRSMRRGRNADFLRGLLGELRAQIPDIVLRTSLIVGLPGETEEDFQLLLDFIREQRFDHLGIFRYSQEEGTLAGEMDGQLDEETKLVRWNQAMELQAEIRAEQQQNYVGKEIEVLVEGPHEETEHLLVGRHAGQAPEIDGQVIINDVPEGGVSPGDIVKVRIEEAYEYDLVGGVTEVVLKAPVVARPTPFGARLPVFNSHR